MSARGILDADMTTIGGWLRDAFRWWTDELAALVPSRWRRGAGSAPRARFDGAALYDAREGRSAAIVLDPALCLVRTIARPAMSERDVDRMIALDVDRLMPMGASAMVVAARIVAREGAAVRIAIAGLPLERAETLATAVASARTIPARVVLETHEGTIDLLPALRRAGLFVRDRSNSVAWWSLVAFLFVLNLGLLVWRDSARTAALEEIVSGQRPAVAVSRAIGGRLAGAERIANAVRSRRAAHDPLALLAAVSSSLPAGAWVQRLTWDGATMKLAGYRPRDANVVTALRGSGAFAGVRNASSDAVAAVPAGQPFEVIVQTRRGAR